MKEKSKSLVLALLILLTMSSCSTADTANNSNNSDETDISVYLELADIYADSGDYDKAIQTIDNALQ